TRRPDPRREAADLVAARVILAGAQRIRPGDNGSGGGAYGSGQGTVQRRRDRQAGVRQSGEGRPGRRAELHGGPGAVAQRGSLGGGGGGGPDGLGGPPQKIPIYRDSTSEAVV